MKLITEITFILIAAVMCMGLLGCASPLSVSLNTGPEQVVGAASDIADFDLPDGYHTVFSASLNDYSVAGFQPGSGSDSSHLYLIQSSNPADSHKLEAALDELTPGTRDVETRMTVVETRPVMVCGQEGTMVISDGVNSEGITYRQALVAFQGKGGPALLAISEPTAGWDQEMVDAVIASIK